VWGYLVALFVPLEHGVQVELVWRLAGLVLVNRLWFVVVAGDPTTTDLGNIGGGVSFWCESNLVPLLSRDIEFLGTRAYDATVAYPGPQVDTTSGVAGGVADDSHSANVAIKMSFQTEAPPGLWLNWHFLGGIPKSMVNLNTIDPSYSADLKDAYDVLLDVFSLFEYRWEATRAVVGGVPLSTRDHFRIDHIRQRTGLVSQRRKRLENPTV
jgi:hypothetical protein